MQDISLDNPETVVDFDYVPTFACVSEPRSSKAYACSVLMHGAVLLCLVRLSVLFASVSTHEITVISAKPEIGKVIYYHLKTLRPMEGLPSITPSGKGGRPGQGNRPKVLPRLGGTTADAQTSIVVRLRHPDGTSQIIHQPSIPPQVRIKSSPRLPNIIADIPMVVQNPIGPVQPHVLVIRRGTGKDTAAAAKPVNAPAIPLKPATNKILALPVNAITPVLAEQQGKSLVNPAPSGTGHEAVGEPSGLIVLSANPGSITDIVGLPYGNSDGSFSVGRAVVGPGSVGGTPNGMIGGGTGGYGDGGDTSTGPGNGNSGGGGKGDSEIAVISGGSSSSSGGLHVSGRSALAIFPVVLPPRTHKSLLTISAGPIGGGGLDTYGALKGGKVYTVYLPGPKRNWVLQYCASAATRDASPQVQQHGNVVTFQANIEAPDPVEAFDFKHVPVPPEKRNRYVILRGLIGKKGELTGLSVYRGVEPELDELALATFTKWKFSPAMRSGSPVAVDILVGIPAVQ